MNKLNLAWNKFLDFIAILGWFAVTLWDSIFNRKEDEQ